MKYFYKTGSCSLFPRIVAAEAGIKLTSSQADLRTKKLESGEDFLKITPKGQVPALQLDNGEVLTEGVAIAQYFASLAPEKKLIPEGWEKFRQLEWLNFITAEVHKTFGGFFAPSVSDETKEKLRGILKTKFVHFETALTKNTYLMGDQFTCADAYLFNVLSWAKYVNVELPKFLQDYSARVAQRPAVQLAMKEEGLG